MGETQVKLKGSRPGPVGKAIRAQEKALRDAGELSTDQELDIAFARQLATVIDAAHRADNAKLVVSTFKELRPIAARLTGGVLNDGGGGSADSPADRLAGIAGAGPTMGDGEAS